MRSWILTVVVLIAMLHKSWGQNSYALKGQEYRNSAKKFRYRNHSDTIKVYEPLFRFYIGGFHAYSKSSFTVNSESTGGGGTDINPAKTFGYTDKKLIPRVELLINPSRKHELNFVYWSIRRERTDSLDQYVQYNNVAFYPNTIVKSKFNLTHYSFAYRHSFISERGCHAGLSFGSKIVETYTRLENVQGDNYSVEKHLVAPLPMVGVHATVNSIKHFSIRGSAEYMKLHRTNWNYQTIDIRAGIEYYPVKHFGIGVDFQYFDTDIQRVPSKKLNGEVDYRFNAFGVYMGWRI